MGRRRNFKDKSEEEPCVFEFSLSIYKTEGLTLGSIHKSTQGLINRTFPNISARDQAFLRIFFVSLPDYEVKWSNFEFRLKTRGKAINSDALPPLQL